MGDMLVQPEVDVGLLVYIKVDFGSLAISALLLVVTHFFLIDISYLDFFFTHVCITWGYTIICIETEGKFLLVCCMSCLTGNRFLSLTTPPLYSHGSFLFCPFINYYMIHTPLIAFLYCYGYRNSWLQMMKFMWVALFIFQKLFNGVDSLR